MLLFLGLAIDPLSQQLVHYDLQPRADLSSEAYVPTALTWDNSFQYDTLFTCKFTVQPFRLFAYDVVTDSLFGLKRGGPELERAGLNARSSTLDESRNSNWSPLFYLRPQRNSADLRNRKLYLACCPIISSVHEMARCLHSPKTFRISRHIRWRRKCDYFEMVPKR